MEKCISCQYYDRRTSAGEGRAQPWGLCRRTSPMLNATRAKNYAVDGVWPTVRDDDWCGEWASQVAKRRIGDAAPGALASLEQAAPRSSPLTGAVPSPTPVTAAAD